MSGAEKSESVFSGVGNAGESERKEEEKDQTTTTITTTTATTTTTTTTTTATISHHPGKMTSLTEENSNSSSSSNSNDTTLLPASASSDPPSKCDSKQSLEDPHTRDKKPSEALDVTRVSNKTKREKPKVKVVHVQSRFKAAAAAAAAAGAKSNSSNNSSGGGGGSSSSSSSRSWSNETLPATLPSTGRRQPPPKTRAVRSRPENLGKTRFATSSSSSSATQPVYATPRLQFPPKVAYEHTTTTRKANTGATTTNKVTKALTATPLGYNDKNSTTLNQRQPTLASASSSSSSSSSSSRAILHSTALNNTTLMMADACSRAVAHHNNLLSSTLLCGATPMGHHRDTRRAAGGVSGVAGFMDLPDISVIRAEETNNSSGNRTILSSVSEEPQLECVGSPGLPEVTADMLEQEYIKYLQWVYVDTHSDLTYQAQVKEMQNQLVFLEELVNNKQEEVAGMRQKAELLRHHQRVGQAHDTQSRLLGALTCNLLSCEEAEGALERELEKKLHQIKMKDIYIPQDQAQYREELTDALRNQVNVLQDLEVVLADRTRLGSDTIALLDNLQDFTQLAQRCDKEVQHAAGLAVEDASHRLGEKPLNLSDPNAVTAAEGAVM